MKSEKLSTSSTPMVLAPLTRAHFRDLECHWEILLLFSVFGCNFLILAKKPQGRAESCDEILGLWDQESNHLPDDRRPRPRRSALHAIVIVFTHLLHVGANHISSSLVFWCNLVKVLWILPHFITTSPVLWLIWEQFFLYLCSHHVRVNHWLWRLPWCDHSKASGSFERALGVGK